MSEILNLLLGLKGNNADMYSHTFDDQGYPPPDTSYNIEVSEKGNFCINVTTTNKDIADLFLREFKNAKKNT